MREVEGEFLEMISRTPTVKSFRFRLKEKIDFNPGQFAEVILEKNKRGLKHYLSFSSSPTKDYVEITKRLSGSLFSQRLEQLESKENVLFRMPLGNCIYKEEYKNTGFIIGGIGITPVISILEYIREKSLDTDSLLIYSNRSEEEIPFRKELDDWSSRNSLRVVYLIAEGRPRAQNIHRGLIEERFLGRYQKELQQRINFIFGPPKMVENIVTSLEILGLKEDRVKIERFIGY